MARLGKVAKVRCRYCGKENITRNSYSKSSCYECKIANQKKAILKRKKDGTFKDLSWKKCDSCGKKTRKIRFIKNQSLCYHCSVGKLHILGDTSGRGRMSLKEVLEKTHYCKTYKSHPNAVHIHLPSVMKGRKVKLVLVEDVPYSVESANADKETEGIKSNGGKKR